MNEGIGLTCQGIKRDFIGSVIKHKSDIFDGLTIEFEQVMSAEEVLTNGLAVGERSNILVFEPEENADVQLFIERQIDEVLNVNH